ncbi:uracil-DNA glycosylase family protein [Edaphobacter aggregans]
MSLLGSIVRWQAEALKIPPPSDTNLLPAVGGLPGPAFFPEGLGLSESALCQNDRPTIIAIGHNFGCQEYRTEIQVAGREDDKPTWRNLDALLGQAGANPSQCFRTNWFVGLLPGGKQTGRFLRKPDYEYQQACLSLLVKQIQMIKPTAILILGPEVASRASNLIPALAPWRGAERWVDIDQSTIGHSVRDVEVSAASIRTNVVALLHPSFGIANQGRRMKNMHVPRTEAEILRAALE